VEELCMFDREARWITDAVLRAIATHCKRLRRLSLSGTLFMRVVYTARGVTALLEGCPLLTDVHITGAKDRLPLRLRAPRPNFTFRDKDFEPCTFWQAPENCSDKY
jgi:hypothetical protein